MSTRSAIVEKTDTGYRAIYCHFDGYPEGVGATLEEHYKDADKVHRLLDLGSISSLGERVEPIGSHSFKEPEEGTTVAYHRDRGEEKWEAQAGATVEEAQEGIGHNGYVYVFEDGAWTVNGKPIPEAIAS